MSSTQISYPEIIRMVHPDTNPSIQDAGNKIATIKRHRDNPNFLYTLAVRWGLVKGQENRSVTFEVGNVIQFFIGNRRKRAVIVYINYDSVASKYRVVVSDIVENRVFEKFFKQIDVPEQEGIEVLGKANSRSRVKADFIYKMYRESEKRRQEAILRPNTTYTTEKYAWIRTLSRRVRITRTTSKRAYYWCQYENKEKYVLLKNATGMI
jgi:hypothetical protein